MTDVIAPSDVTEWQPAISADDPALALIVPAVNAYVSRLPVVADLAAGVDPDPDVKLGAIMLAAKIHRRRNSPNGIEAVTGDGVAFVARHDPEITRALRLDRPVAS